jgi:hypothetical protein
MLPPVGNWVARCRHCPEVFVKQGFMYHASATRLLLKRSRPPAGNSSPSSDLVTIIRVLSNPNAQGPISLLWRPWKGLKRSSLTPLVERRPKTWRSKYRWTTVPQMTSILAKNAAIQPRWTGAERRQQFLHLLRTIAFVQIGRATHDVRLPNAVTMSQRSRRPQPQTWTIYSSTSAPYTHIANRQLRPHLHNHPSPCRKSKQHSGMKGCPT